LPLSRPSGVVVLDNSTVGPGDTTQRRRPLVADAPGERAGDPAFLLCLFLKASIEEKIPLRELAGEDGNEGHPNSSLHMASGPPAAPVGKALTGVTDGDDV
jgi:hypothetical protein